MGGFLKVLEEDARSFVPWVLWVTVTVAVAVSGPFGSYGTMTLFERALFWTPVICVSVAVTSVNRAYVIAVLQLDGRLSGSLVSALLNCAVLCPPLYLLIHMVFPPLFSSYTNAGEIGLLVASMSLGICALRESGSGDAADLPAAAEVFLPRLMRRIDPDQQGEIWAITVRDHYVDVQTCRGKASLLMRFSDAIEEVNCLPGAQVHRSHWVAWAGVGSVCREGSKINLHLKSGHQIPVSRNHRDKVDAQFPPMITEKAAAA